jgi:hypothetical protein
MRSLVETAGDVLIGLVPSGGWVAIAIPVVSLYRRWRGLTWDA